MDLHSKMIIGYSYQRHMEQEIVLESLRQAVYKTKQTKGIIVQSDLGSQYLSYDVEQFIEKMKGFTHIQEKVHLMMTHRSKHFIRSSRENV